MTAKEQTVALPFRSHTFLGVCEAIGEDFGFNANYLRVPLGAIVVVNVMAAVAVYLALGVIVLASRLMFPTSRTVVQADAATPAPANSDIEEQLAA